MTLKEEKKNDLLFSRRLKKKERRINQLSLAGISRKKTKKKRNAFEWFTRAEDDYKDTPRRRKKTIRARKPTRRTKARTKTQTRRRKRTRKNSDDFY